MRSVLREGRQWALSPLPDEKLIEAIRLSLDCSHPFAVLLARRGGTSWEILIDPDRQGLHSPSDMPAIERAVDRLERAIADQQRVFVHGDFDVDGLTAAAVLYRGLRPFLPKNSIKVEVGSRHLGHGLSRPFVRRVIDEGFDLVITADCGINNVEEIRELADAGIETLVTDHHQPPAELPAACAIVDPYLAENRYPNPDLAGVGVAYKLVCALYERRRQPAPTHLLDLVATGTIADLVPLCSTSSSENRAIVRKGFSLIMEGEGSSLGLRVLMDKLSVNPKKISTTDISYHVAPKLNAANRAGDPKVAFLLLITELTDQAEYLSEILLDYNRDREIAQNDLVYQAEQTIRTEEMDPQEDGYAFVVGQYWNEGLLGLVASGLADRYRVPAFVLSRGDRVSRGSCRSVGEFDINSCLEAQSELLLQYGGHRMAAGFSAPNESLESLEQGIAAYVSKHQTQITVQASESIDAALSLSDVDMRLYTNLESLAPYGPGNPSPRFLLRDCSFANLSLVGNRRQHLKGHALQNGDEIPFIGFRMGRHLETFEAASKASLICRVGFDDWQSAVQVQGIDLIDEQATDPTSQRRTG